VYDIFGAVGGWVPKIHTGNAIPVTFRLVKGYGPFCRLPGPAAPLPILENK
jgi:hypothetical protein